MNDETAGKIKDSKISRMREPPINFFRDSSVSFVRFADGRKIFSNSLLCLQQVKKKFKLTKKGAIIWEQTTSLPRHNIRYFLPEAFLY